MSILCCAGSSFAMKSAHSLGRCVCSAQKHLPAAVRTEAHVALSPVYGQPLLLFNLLDAASGALLPHAEVCGQGRHVLMWGKGCESSAEGDCWEKPQQQAKRHAQR